ncbi:hypothetical protein PILCRDRAFT_16892 [Piloderma croceum F 1598]|uniref:Uncharacterized protein n=1 Tax=Piloderma croceum (strain F 1598) TaxID=765440 RepID=A0A0C3EUC0_PILCF|nr:hypothetical protein PILCRDRAFT_16892 [Piloderma croceum F 1598]
MVWLSQVLVHPKLGNVKVLPVWKDSRSHQLSQSLGACFLQEKSEAIWPKENLGQNAMGSRPEILRVPYNRQEQQKNIQGIDLFDGV